MKWGRICEGSYWGSELEWLSLLKEIDMKISEINSSGRLTIPIAFRKKYNLKKWTKIVFIESGDRIIIQTLDKNYFANLAGLLSEKDKMFESLAKDKLLERKL